MDEVAEGCLLLAFRFRGYQVQLPGVPQPGFLAPSVGGEAVDPLPLVEGHAPAVSSVADSLRGLWRLRGRFGGWGSTLGIRGAV